MELLVIPVWQTSTSKLRQCFVLTLLSCGSHSECISPRRPECAHNDLRPIWQPFGMYQPSCPRSVLIMTSAVSVISATTTTLLPLLPLLQLYCHCCKACHSTATAAKPATLLPFSHPDCISPRALVVCLQ